MRTPLIVLLAGLVLSFAPAAFSQTFKAAQQAGSDKAMSAVKASESEVLADDVMRHLEILTSEDFEGRNTGLKGGYMAGAYAATCFDAFGLVPGGDSNTWFQAFPYTAGFKVPDEGNTATIDWGGGVLEDLRSRGTYAPLTFSPNGDIANAPIVFAGFGINAGEDYNNYQDADGEDLDVKGKWVMVLRGRPVDKKDKPFTEQQSLIGKAYGAKQRGAAGVIFVKADNKTIPGELTQFTSVGQNERILPAVSIRNKVADQLLGERDLAELYKAFDAAEEIAGFELDASFAASFEVRENQSNGRNVIGVLPAGDKPAGPAIVFCAHIDHLGFGKQGGSRAKGRQKNQLHPGADDNGSGTAALFEVAQVLAARKAAGTITLERDIVFIAFSGEELGLWGSRFYVNDLKTSKQLAELHGCINLDMMGRLKNGTFTLTGLSTSDDWNALLDTVSPPEGLTVKRVNRSPAGDSLPFSRNGVPSLFGYTGMHDDYHTPADTLDKLNVPGIALIANYLADVTVALANQKAPLAFKEPPKRPAPPKVLVGLVPEDAEDPGVLIKSVSDGFPAEQAGIKIGDVITGLAGKPVKNTEDLFKILRTLKPDKEVAVEVQRDGELVKLKITPVARS